MRFFFCELLSTSNWIWRQTTERAERAVAGEAGTEAARARVPPRGPLRETLTSEAASVCWYAVESWLWKRLQSTHACPPVLYTCPVTSTERCSFNNILGRGAMIVGVV